MWLRIRAILFYFFWSLRELLGRFGDDCGILWGQLGHFRGIFEAPPGIATAVNDQATLISMVKNEGTMTEAADDEGLDPSTVKRVFQFLRSSGDNLRRLRKHHPHPTQQQYEQPGPQHHQPQRQPTPQHQQQ